MRVGIRPSRAEHLHFHIVVIGIDRIAVRPEPRVAGADCGKGYVFAEAGLRVFRLGAGALAGGVVGVIIEDGGHSGGEGSVVGDLDDDVVVGAAVAVVMPDFDVVEGVGSAEVELDPLGAGADLHPVGRSEIVIGDEGWVATKGGARGGYLAQRQVGGGGIGTLRVRIVTRLAIRIIVRLRVGVAGGNGERLHPPRSRIALVQSRAFVTPGGSVPQPVPDYGIVAAER